MNKQRRCRISATPLPFNLEYSLEYDFCCIGLAFNINSALAVKNYRE
jgi:hypothetical protein